MHGGRILDFQVEVSFYPDAGFGLYLSTNGPAQYDPPALTLMAMYINDLLLGEDPWLTPETACTFPEPWFPKRNHIRRQRPPFPSDMPSESLESYIGVYSHPGFGNITILSNTDNTQLYLYLGQFLEAALHYDASEKTFYAELTGKLWFMTERYPVRFAKQYTTDTFDTLYMPMSDPYDEAFPFLNGKARELRAENEKQKTKGICSNATKYYYSTTALLKFIVVIVTFCVLSSFC